MSNSIVLVEEGRLSCGDCSTFCEPLADSVNLHYWTFMMLVRSSLHSFVLECSVMH